MIRYLTLPLLALTLCACGPAETAGTLPGAHASIPAFDELESTWTDSASAVRCCANHPASFDPRKTHEVLLILYALPNGNTIEQTKGRRATEGMDWHFGIQHIAAQTRALRQLYPRRTVAIAYLEAAGLSWPRWRRDRADAGERITRLVDSLRASFGAADVRVALSGHSGGGSFMFGFINACDVIPSYIERITFLDSNYGFSDGEGHTSKLLAWLRGDSTRVLSVIAYDDREIVLEGKKVIGPDGGTYRRTLEMVQCLGRELELEGSRRDSLLAFEGMKGQIELLIHLNPANNILHTRLVGEMNGFLHAMTLKRREVIPLKGPEVYGEFVGED